MLSEFEDLVRSNRSFRRFDENRRVGMGRLENYVDIARLSQSAMNRQPLRYILIDDRDLCEKVFPHMNWAGYLRDWQGPAPGERPAAYIAVCCESDAKQFAEVDAGISMQNITLAACSEGVGCCVIGSVRKKAVSQLLHIGGEYELMYLIAFGFPVEDVSLVEMKNNEYEYYRDENSRHFVPKRSLDEVVIGRY